MGVQSGSEIDFAEWKRRLDFEGTRGGGGDPSASAAASTSTSSSCLMDGGGEQREVPVSPPKSGHSGYYTMTSFQSSPSSSAGSEGGGVEVVGEGGEGERPGLGWCEVKERFSRPAYSKFGHDFGLQPTRVLDREQLDMIAMERNLYKHVQELSVLTELLGYPLIQENGQRRFGPHPMAKDPPRGCEVFVGKVPKHLNEAHIYTVFQHAGKVHQIRLMMDFNGGNRGFCFVQFSHPGEAKIAIAKLNQYEITPGRRIGVTESVDNCRLYLGGIPADKSEQDIFDELSRVTEGLTGVTIKGRPNEQGEKLAVRGFAFAEYKTHRDAAMARRKMIPGKILLWQKLIHVDWAEPEQQNELVTRLHGGKIWLNNGVTTVLQRGRFYNNFECQNVPIPITHDAQQGFEQFQESGPQLSPFLPQLSPYDSQFPRLDPQFSRHGSQFPRFDPQFSGHDSQFLRHDPQFPQFDFDPQFPPFDPQLPRHNPQFPRFDPQFSRHDPQFSRHDPQFSRHEPQLSSNHPIFPMFPPNVSNYPNYPHVVSHMPPPGFYF